MTPREQFLQACKVYSDAVEATMVRGAAEYDILLQRLEDMPTDEASDADQLRQSAPIEVEMRLRSTCSATWQWQCRFADAWLTPCTEELPRTFSTKLIASETGKRCLAALSEHLGVKLRPKWEGEQPVEPTPQPAEPMTVEKLIVILRESFGSPGPLNWVLVINDLTALVQAQARRDALLLAAKARELCHSSQVIVKMELLNCEQAILKSAGLDECA